MPYQVRDNQRRQMREGGKCSAHIRFHSSNRRGKVIRTAIHPQVPSRSSVRSVQIEEQVHNNLPSSSSPYPIGFTSSERIYNLPFASASLARMEREDRLRRAD